MGCRTVQGLLRDRSQTPTSTTHEGSLRRDRAREKRGCKDREDTAKEDMMPRLGVVADPCARGVSTGFSKVLIGEGVKILTVEESRQRSRVQVRMHETGT